MAYNVKRGIAAANAECAAVCALLDSGYLRVYSGTQPETVDTAITDQVLLAELRFGATAAGAPLNGVSTFNALTPDASANASGTPTWARALESDGTTGVADCTVGLSGCDAIIDASPITSGATVSVTSMIYMANRG